MSIWNFSADSPTNLQSPLKIVANLCNELSQISKGRVIARVTEYNGKYKSIYKKPDQLYKTSPKYFMEMSIIPEFNVQEIMGDKAADDDYNNKFVYELFLTSKNTPKYRYRVFIMYYGIGMYPVGLTIQKDIAKEANLNSEGAKCDNEDEFIDALKRILGSATVGSVLNNLVALNS